MSVDIQDVITCAAFCDDRLRGSGWQGVEFPVFPLTCVVALTTLALPCEYVIQLFFLTHTVIIIIIIIIILILET